MVPVRRSASQYSSPLPQGRAFHFHRPSFGVCRVSPNGGTYYGPGQANCTLPTPRGRGAHKPQQNGKMDMRQRNGSVIYRLSIPMVRRGFEKSCFECCASWWAANAAAQLHNWGFTRRRNVCISQTKTNAIQRYATSAIRSSANTIMQTARIKQSDSVCILCDRVNPRQGSDTLFCKFRNS